jgi:hypothetical protein
MIRRTVKRFWFGCAARDDRMFRRPRMRSPDCGLDASRKTLPGLLRQLWQRLPEPSKALDTAAWENAPYRPVPGIIDAACTLYSHHGVADIAAARADARNLSTTTRAILQSIEQARVNKRHSALFVTGIPGAGKTLCGLNAVSDLWRPQRLTLRRAGWAKCRLNLLPSTATTACENSLS